MNISSVEEKVLGALRERGVFAAAARTHECWTKDLEAKYPKGPRGGLHPILRCAKKLLQKINSCGPEALADDLLPKFAYAAERWKQITDPDVLSEFPYLRYLHIDPTGTSPPNRATHQAQHGKIYRVDDPFWDTWYPLNGLGCMCTTMSISETHLRREGWQVSDNRRFEFRFPDEGFDFNIGKVLS